MCFSCIRWVSLKSKLSLEFRGQSFGDSSFGDSSFGDSSFGDSICNFRGCLSRPVHSAVLTVSAPVCQGEFSMLSPKCLIATSLEAGALPPGLGKAAVLEALTGGKALGAASLVLRFNH